MHKTKTKGLKLETKRNQIHPLLLLQRWNRKFPKKCQIIAPTVHIIYDREVDNQHVHGSGSSITLQMWLQKLETNNIFDHTSHFDSGLTTFVKLMESKSMII
uniref:Uncharacterized protein n=1 Tax=Aplanochytrium stocchinoi TaxID=215587 RepID=A0A7S3UYX2_9STRA|mmetsp:Transcript_11795/g.14681  ORF Transcript_11795/g.14681 Transcript_11795/m.14681 type:complete len:102 (-) Transcript_11795:828-1133(-)